MHTHTHTHTEMPITCIQNSYLLTAMLNANFSNNTQDSVSHNWYLVKYSTFHHNKGGNYAKVSSERVLWHLHKCQVDFLRAGTNCTRFCQLSHMAPDVSANQKTSIKQALTRQYQSATKTCCTINTEPRKP